MPQEFKVKNGLIVDQGGATITGSVIATSGFTGSLQGTASNALTASFIDTASTNAFVQGGNSFGATALLGTNDTQNLALETSGSTRMFISSSGNVGIGTISPINTLDVAGTVRLLSGGSYLTLNNATYSELGYTATNYFRANGAAAIVNGPQIQFLTGGTERMRISGSGNVGIGTTTPATTLEVNGVIRTPQMSIGGFDPGRNQFLTYTSGPVYRMFAGSAYGSLGVGSFSVGSTYGGISGSVNTVLIEGNTSIGTTTQSARLHVRGSGATSATTALQVENSSASPSLIVLDNGYVGIGTGSAAYKLDVLDSAATYVAQFRGSNSSYIISGDTSLAGESGLNARNSTGQMFLAISASIITLSGAGGANTVAFRPGGSERMRVNSSGNVLIGTTTDAGFRLDVSGSGRFTNGLTVTGSLIAPSITGSLQGTASWADRVVSASGVNTSIQYNNNSALFGSSRFTFNGTNVQFNGAGGGVMGITGSLLLLGNSTISGSSIITGSLQVGVPGTNDAAIDTTVGTLSRGTQARVDWLNGSLYNTSGVLTADWENTSLYDGSGVLSLAWNDRFLSTPGGNSFAWDNEYHTTSTLYQYYAVGITTQNDFIDNLSEPFVGQIIEGTIDTASTAGQLVNLEPDGTWYPVKNLAPQATKMLGICVNQGKGLILLEGDVGVSDDNTYGTYVVSASMGLPVYVGTTNGELDTTQPGSGVIRIVGHIYYQSTTTANYWLMKFRPSNNWT